MKRSVLGLGRMDGLDSSERAQFILLLDRLLAKGKDIFWDSNPLVVRQYVEKVHDELIALKKVDLCDGTKLENDLSAHRKAHEHRFVVKAMSLKHTDVKEIGAEHLCIQTIEKLKIDKTLMRLGFSESETILAITQIAARACHPASELATAKWIKERSDICRLTGFDSSKITKDALYKSALRLYEVREGLSNHLSSWTKELFGYEDKIVLYDLTNTYFEGQMKRSKVAKRGRSKEKRSDCKLIVLAMVVNQYGFPKHYELFEGNMSDPQSLPKIIDLLDKKLKSLRVNPTIVFDAGIATESNLQLLRDKGYKYLCVSRSSSKPYTPKADTTRTQVKDNRGQLIELQAVTVPTDESGDHYYWVRSEAKAAKENGMSEQFNKRYEGELEKIKASFTKKHGTKKIEKVYERIGRAKQKYPSVASHYEITVTEDKEKGIATELEWVLKPEYVQNDTAGVYFLRTNIEEEIDETTVWEIYNLLGEVESTFRTLKTDLDLRPIYHKKDESSLAHLHLGILAYWVVVTIRHQLKQKGIRHGWKQLLEIMNTHKSITSTMRNLIDEEVKIERCSEPTEEVEQIYQTLKISPQPYKPIKSVGTHLKVAKNRPALCEEIDSG